MCTAARCWTGPEPARLSYHWASTGSGSESGFPFNSTKGNPISVLSDLQQRHNDVLTEIASLSDTATQENRELSQQETARSRQLLTDADTLEARISEEAEQASTQARITEARARISGGSSHDGVRVSVAGEPMTYGGGRPHSYYADSIILARGNVMDVSYRAAFERMGRWSHEVEVEVAERSQFGREAERQLREVLRTDNEVRHQQAIEEVRSRGRVAADLKQDGTESRAITSGSGTTVSAAGGGAASFVTPVFGTPYIPYREYGRAFADQCFKAPLPDYGLAIYKPQVTGPAGVSQWTENNTVTEVDPTAGYEVATLAIFAGEVTLSQVILDRMAPDYRFDVMCEDQLQRDYAPKWDTYVLTQALAGATSQAWTGNAGVFDLSVASGSGGFYGQVSKAKATMRKLQGTVLNPTHLFLDPARYEYIAAWADTQGRPLVVPDYAGPFNAAANSGDGDAGIEGATGTRFNGLPVYTDANIPTTTTSHFDQALVGCLTEVECYEGTAINRVLPQTLASQLLVVLQRYSYGTVLVNYPGAVTSINGSGMAAIGYTN